MPVYLIENPRCVFIRIPKTGSTSIIRGPFDNAVKGKAFGKIPQEWRKEKSFAFVRNPFDRLVSAWFMFKSFPARTEHEQNLQKHLTIAKLIEIVTDDRISLIGDDFLAKLRRHSIPLTHPFNCLSRASLIGRFENFEEDLRWIGNQLGVVDLRAPHLRRIPRGHYSKYFRLS